MVNKKIRSLSPKALVERMRYEGQYIKLSLSDFLRYRKYASVCLNESKGLQNLSASMIMEAHKIEKAFSLPAPRPGFGRAVIPRLINMITQYKKMGGGDSLAYTKARSVLAQYLVYHDQIGYDLGSFKDEILPWADFESNTGGYNDSIRAEWLKKAVGGFEECALSRSSVRTYSGEPISEEMIKDIIRISRKTPSVCNRQSWHTYIVKTPEKKIQVMELQGGCFGFGDTADFLAVITTNMHLFSGAFEKNQSYVDGGMYAMSFLYALHSKGLGGCPLHCMLPPQQLRKLRSLLCISESENIIMVVSVGNLTENIRTAKSVRHDVEDQVTFI